MSEMIDSMNARSCVAQNVSHCLEKSEMSFADLANAVGTTATTIYRVVHAANDPAFTLVARIADYFGVSTDDLMREAADFRRIYKRLREARQTVPA